MKKNKGFTLIELSVIVFIVGLMGLYVIPNIGDRLFHTQTKLSLRRIAGNIKYVFNQAAIKGQTYSFVIDIDKDRYWVPGMSDIDRDLSNKIDFVDVMAVAKEKSTTGEKPILFTPRGLSEKHFIHVLSKDTYYYTLIISPLTGHVEILDGYIEYNESGEKVVHTKIKREKPKKKIK